MFKPAFYRVLFILNPGEEADLQSISERLNVTLSTARRYVRELLKKGYLEEKRPGRYCLTESGEVLRRSLGNILKKKIDPSLGYVITDPISGAPVPVKITNIKQLYAVLKYRLVPDNIMKEHIKRGYLTKWVNDVLGDHDLAAFLEDNRDISLDELTRVIENKIKIIESISAIKVI